MTPLVLTCQVKVPRFARKKFCGVGAGSGEGGRSAVWDELRRLLREADEEDESSAAEDEEAQEQPTSHVVSRSYHMGHLVTGS